MRRYFRNIGVASTQWLAQWTGKTVNANETTSGVAYRLRNKGYGKLYRLINAVFFWQDDHCKAAAKMEVKDCEELLVAYGAIVIPPDDEEAFEDVPNVLDPIPAAAVPDVVEEINTWAWTEFDYMDYIDGPAKWENKVKFYNDIKEWGFDPKDVRMSSKEYKHWAKKAIADATEWVAKHDTPPPAPHHGMTE